MTIELHLIIDSFAVEMHKKEHGDNIMTTYDAANRIIGYEDVVYTTIPHFLQFRYAERLYVHVGESVHEIKKGCHKSNGTRREIREAHNIEKLLFAGEFSWYIKI